MWSTVVISLFFPDGEDDNRENFFLKSFSRTQFVSTITNQPPSPFMVLCLFHGVVYRAVQSVLLYIINFYTQIRSNMWSPTYLMC